MHLCITWALIFIPLMGKKQYYRKTPEEIRTEQIADPCTGLYPTEVEFFTHMISLLGFTDATLVLSGLFHRRFEPIELEAIMDGILSAVFMTAEN